VIAAADANPEAKYAETFLRAFYAEALKSKSARGEQYRRADAQAASGREYGAAVDPDDLDHRSQRGANAAVRDPGEHPDLSSMDLRQVKQVAMALGSYGNRQSLAAKVLDRLRELGAGQVADMFERAWGDLDEPSDDEAERGGDAHADELEAAVRLTAANRDALRAPSIAAIKHREKK
jgi:hypothetical protein